MNILAKATKNEALRQFRKYWWLMCERRPALKKRIKDERLEYWLIFLLMLEYDGEITPAQRRAWTHPF